jgi:hypothetical protein
MSEVELAAAVAPAITLTAVGYMVLILVGAYLLYQFSRLYSSIADSMESKTKTESRYNLFERAMITQLADKVGVNLEKEEVLENEKVAPKTFRKAVHDELIKKLTEQKTK